MSASRSLRWVVLLLVAALTAASGQASAPPPLAVFHALGSTDSTIVRDATKVGSVISAVGSAFNPLRGPSGALDAALWTIDGTNPAVITTLPDFVVGTANISAEAITPDGAYIASQGRDTGGPSASRVTTSGLTNQNLNASPYTAFIKPTSARTISDNGAILYGTARANVPVTSFVNTPFVAVRNRAVRFDEGTGTSALINPIPASADLQANPVQQFVLQRAASSDGSVVLGWNFQPNNATPVDQAFRYTNDGNGATTVTNIPRIAEGGTWNRPLALSGDGNLAVVFGNSAAHTTGEVYLYNATSSAVTRLGSPNSPWTTGIAGITDDGSVVALSMSGTCSPGPCSPPRYAYIHNANGWFHLTSVLAGAGVDLGPEWSGLSVLGMNGDGTLVFGSGIHNGVQEGFVAEFPADFLKTFDIPTVVPTDTRIVGAWRLADANPDPALASDTIVMFLADGTYIHMEANVPATETNSANGFERGRYTWDSTSSVFTSTTLLDTDGEIGLSGTDAQSGIMVSIAGDNLTFTMTECIPGPNEPCIYTLSRVAIAPGSLVGGWFFGDATIADSSAVLVLLDNGAYYFAQDGIPDPSGYDGIERGTWLWNAATGDFEATTVVDTNGEWGLSHPFGPITIQLSPDQLRFTATDGPDSFIFNRVTVTTVVTPLGTNVVVEPTSSTGTTPVSIQFTEVTGGGETTLQVIDPSSAESPVPPAGFALGDPPLYYELDTTATFTGPVTVCFNYGGVTFASGTPRLLHYDESLQSWVDITTSIDAATTTICGLTSTFSPFAIASSQTTHSGFAAPISPVGGYQNVVKGGSTVPLKFNVFVNGVEKTDTTGLLFTVAQISCDASSGETPVDFTTTGGTSLRYGGNQFVQNWKTPTMPGCYFVRVTGDGLLVSALFRVK